MSTNGKRTAAAKQLGILLESPAGYPELFNRAKPKPLALRIQHQIKAALPQAPTKAISAYLYWWTKQTAYLSAVAASRSIRINLDGSAAGPVTPQHRKHADQMLAGRIRKASA